MSSSAHPAYPSTAILARENDADAMADCLAWANLRVGQIIRKAVVDIKDVENELADNGIPVRLCGPLSWSELYPAMEDLIPEVDRPELEQYCFDQLWATA